MPVLQETITFNGETLTINQWAAKINVSPQSLSNRLSAGWPLEDALTQPRGIRGMSAYMDIVDAERRRHERALKKDAAQLKRQFKKLVHDIDRALSAFNYRLEALGEDGRGEGEKDQSGPCDRSTHSSQDRP